MKLVQVIQAGGAAPVNHCLTGSGSIEAAARSIGNYLEREPQKTPQSVEEDSASVSVQMDTRSRNHLPQT